MTTPIITFNHFIEEFSRLPLEDQEMLLDILKKRTIEQKRTRVARAITETLYLLGVPGMRESIREGLKTPLEECLKELHW